MKTVITQLEKQFKKNSTVIVALSGGPDSVYLLHLLKKIQKKKNLKLIGAHLNHKTRIMSNRDERFCKKLCKKLNVDFESKRVDLKNTSEDKSRKARYEFLNELKKKYKAPYIATGHHLNDSIETVLLNLTRGCSLQGLTGIQDRDNILRPLSQITKKEILEFLSKNKIKFVTDSTNKQNLYSRNKVRNIILPILKKINPGLEKNFARNIRNFQKIQNFIQAQAKDWLEKNGNLKTTNTTFDVKELKKLDEVLQNEILALIYKKHTNSTFGLTTKQIENTREIILKNKNLKGKLGKVNFQTSYGTCEISPGRPGSETQTTFRHTVKIIDKDDFCRTTKHGQKNNATKQFKNKKKNTIYIRGDINAELLQLRTWHSGDRFQPLGLKKGTKKLQDFFTDKKIPKNKRNKIPILTYKKDIVAVGDIEISEKYKVTKNTKQILKIQLK